MSDSRTDTSRFASFDIASRAAALSFGSNAILMTLKITMGLVFGSIAVLGDGVDSAEDLFASGLAFFTVRLALQPADEAHPYGHGKAESLAAMSQGALIAGGAVFIAIAAILRMIARDSNIQIGPSLITIGITAVVNVGVAAYSRHAARVSGSVAISADARHLMTNVVQAVAIGAGLSLVAITGHAIFDQIVALLLAAFLLYIAAGIFRDALRELIDTALPAASLTLINDALTHPTHGVRGYHELRTRKSGREIHIDLHVLVDPELSVREAHALIEHIDEELRTKIPGARVTVHVDPDEPAARDDSTALQDAGIHVHRE